jgi:branched-chain amino acid transport system substrate-binding protein
LVRSRARNGPERSIKQIDARGHRDRQDARVRLTYGIGLTVAMLAGGSGIEQPQAAAQSGTVTIYSSLPLSGASRPQTVSIVRGARMALEERGGAAGPHAVRYISLNDATSSAGSWTPERTARNARRAARDASAIGYIGEFNSGASAVSMPFLSAAGIAQISPSNTYIGLTRGGPGAARGEPSKYYVGGLRHYFRITPNDRVQGGALATAMRDRGCRRVASVTDGELYGRGVGVWTRRSVTKLGLRIIAVHTIHRRSPAARLGRIVRARPDCVAYTGITANGAVRFVSALARRLPRARFFGSDGIAESGFADRKEGGVSRRVARRVLVTVATVAPYAYPPAGREFFDRYKARFNDPHPDPYSIYGYESMQLMLDAAAAAGPSRPGVIAWLRSVADRPSVLGSYGFDRFGDTTLRTYGVYGIRSGELTYSGAVEAPQ